MVMVRRSTLMTTRLRCWSPRLPLILTLQMTGLGRRPSHQHRRRALVLVLVCVQCIVVEGEWCVVRKVGLQLTGKARESHSERACIFLALSDLHALTKRKRPRHPNSHITYRQHILLFLLVVVVASLSMRSVFICCTHSSLDELERERHHHALCTARWADPNTRRVL